MEDLINFINNSGIDIVAFYNSTFFSIIKFILGIYAAVIFADIVLMSIQRGLSGDLRETLYGMNMPPELTKKKGKLKKNWNKKIIEKLKSSRETDWKIAIIEADEIIDDLLDRLGYSGENMGERLKEVSSNQIENIDELRQAHEFKNRIVHEDDLELTKEKTEEIIGYYENFLKYFEVL